jgi:uncharacterized protein (TIGR02266 family)
MDEPSSTESNAITLRIKFKSASLDEFISRYGVDVSPGGIFIRTKQPVDVGTSLQFDFTLADGSSLLAGLGTVAWVRESDPARANNVPGMGLRFDKLVPESQHTHQLILAEKARLEGKALSTPYPPTSFVAPVTKLSPPPDDLRAATEIAEKMGRGSANLAVTRPAPTAAVKPAPLVASTPIAPVDESGGDTDEFESAGKTEISDKPLDFYLKEAAQEAEAAQNAIGKAAEEAVPTSLIEDFNTEAAELPSTKSGPPPAGFDAQDSAPNTAAGENAPAKPLSGERKSGGREAFASLLDLGESPVSSGVDAAAPSEVLEEISAGAPIEETPSEKTEEVSLSPSAPPPAVAAPEPFDLGGASLSDDRPPSRDGVPSLKPKGSGKLIAGIAVLAAAAAFGAVYLAKTKPWQEAQPEPVQVAVPPPAPAVTPTPAAKPTPQAPEPGKPAVAEEAVAKKPVAEEAKPAVAEKPVAEKPGAEKAAAEKPSAEKAMVTKAEPESSGAKPASKSGTKAGGKTGEEKAGADEEEAYRLVFRSTPIGAEVLIDGEYFARTPCERRILDPKKSYAITIRREGYEPHERLLGASDNWVKKGNERVLNVTVNLKKVSAPTAGEGSSAAPAKTPEPAKPEAKPAAVPAETAKPAAAKPEPAKPEAAKPEAAKPAAPAAEKPTVFKPVPNFEEPGKAKE